MNGDGVAVRRAGPLLLRILSALVLVPASLAAVWFGPPWLTLLVAAAGLAMGWEWGRLTDGGVFGRRGWVIVATVIVAVAGVAAGRPLAALVVAAIGAVAAALVGRGERPWAALGTLWIVAGCVAFLWLDGAAQGGRWGIVWLLGLVWATDITAYFVGKSLGGPRLAPRLSPNKTWSGAAGGLLGAALVGLVAALLAAAPILSVIAISLGLSVCAQAGDLAESWAKRHFGVKDASNLIPGHGGMLDRLDGLLAAAITAALLTIVLGGAALDLG
ncbi:MAG TPA: phosphatidate cytidylyltransferase [Stellaceae bacterium]